MTRTQTAIAVWVCNAALSLAIGSILVGKAELAILITTVVAVTGVFSIAKHMAITGFTAATCMLVCGTIDILGHVSAGRVSGYAVLTIGVTVLLVFVSSTSSALATAIKLRSVLFPFVGLAMWALLSVLWSRPTVDGMQNVLLYVSFPALLLVSATAARTEAIRPPTFARLVDVTFLIGALFYFMSLLASGVGGSAVASARCYALFGMIGVAWGAARYRYGFREGLFVAAVSLTMVFLSLSRLAAVAAVIVAILAFVDLKRFARSLIATVLIGSIAFLVVTHTTSFSSRFEKGDIRSVAGLKLNVSGRTQLWSITWDSYKTSPFIGHGVGSAEALIELKYPGEDHPHNDYLRLLHDLGAVGLFLFLAGYVSILTQLYRSSSEARKSRHAEYLRLASILSFLAILFAMITDNPIVYFFVMTPVAVISGYSLGVLLALKRPKELEI